MSTAIKPFSVKLGGATGISPHKTRVERRLSDMHEYFSDKNLIKRMLASGEDPVVYEVYEVPQKPIQGMFNIGCTVIYPGKIGDEYFFTMGHFHQKETTSEVYVGMEGEGVILMQDREGKTVYLKIEPNILAYIPPRMAHRTVNTGKEKLVFLAVYPSEAGHDYETIRTKGFAKLVIEKDGKYAITENPHYAL